VIDLEEFLAGICTVYRGNYEDTSALLFKIFDMAKKGYIIKEDIFFILSYLPSSCPKCGKCVEIPNNVIELINDLFNETDELTPFLFQDKISKSRIWKIMMQSLLNSLPLILDEAMMPSMMLCLPQNFFEIDKLTYKGTEYYFQLKNQVLYYSYNQNITPVEGIILIKDLYVEPLDELSFVLRNPRLRYELKAMDSNTRDTWVTYINYGNGFKDIKDDYEFRQIIGKGAYGVVRLAVNKETSKQHAIKIIHKTPLDHKNETRLRREIDILKVAKHNNLLHLDALYETADTVYIVTEYVQDGTLFHYLEARNFKLPEDIAKNILKELASGLMFLHSLGVIHRDLKLENIILDIKDNRIRPVIIDYGLSIILGPLQQADEGVGTLKYAAPELLYRFGYREAVDIWSLGVITYIMLSGKMPFFGRDDNDVAKSIINRRPDTKHKGWENVSRQGINIVKNLLRKNPSKRLAMSELLIDEWLTSELSCGIKVPTSTINRNPFSIRQECVRGQTTKSY
jgi:tRNA A-37 threonylcarbamoyl transferase component Bud32